MNVFGARATTTSPVPSVFSKVSLTWKCDQKAVPPSQDQNHAGRWCKARDWHEKKTDQRGDKERQDRIKLCFKIKVKRGVKFFSAPHLSNLKPWKSQAMFQCLTSIYSSLAEPPQITSCIAMCAVCKHADWKMFFLTADVQCDFGSYLLPREGIRGGGMMRQNGKKKKSSHGRKRQTVGKESEKGGKSSRRGNRFQEEGTREREWWRWMESDNLGGGNQWECEEKWQRHRVIQRKLGCRQKLKEQWQRAETLLSHGLWSLNIYINNVRDMRKPPGNEIQGCASG